MSVFENQIFETIFARKQTNKRSLQKSKLSMKKYLFFFLCCVCASQGVWAKSILSDTTKKKYEQQAQARDEEIGLIEKPTQDGVGKVPYWKDKLQKKKQLYGKKQHKKGRKGNFIELDPLMIALAFILGILLLLLLWLLFKGIGNLSFGWAFLLSIGFALALFFWLLARSEAVDTVAWYEYFIKFGIFAFIGLALILGGFIAMFGGMPNMINFFLWGVILGGISLIISIIFNNSVLNEIFPFWFR